MLAPCSFLHTSAAAQIKFRGLGLPLVHGWWAHRTPAAGTRFPVLSQSRLEPVCSTDPMVLVGLRWPLVFPRQGKWAMRALCDGHLALRVPRETRLSALLTALQGLWGPACTQLGQTRVDGARRIASIRSPGILSRPNLLFLIGIIYKCIGFLFLFF